MVGARLEFMLSRGSLFGCPFAFVVGLRRVTFGIGRKGKFLRVPIWEVGGKPGASGWIWGGRPYALAVRKLCGRGLTVSPSEPYSLNPTETLTGPLPLTPALQSISQSAEKLG